MLETREIEKRQRENPPEFQEINFFSNDGCCSVAKLCVTELTTRQRGSSSHLRGKREERP